MTCFRVGGAIMCGRGSRRRRSLGRRECRWPGCERSASQAEWACRQHFFKLSPDLRNRLWLAHRGDLRASGRLGQAWEAVAEEADRFAAGSIEGRRGSCRQPELPL